MKKCLLIILVVSTILSLSSCNDLKKMMKNAKDINYSVNPDPLEMHAGKVAVSITGNFPEKYFRKKVSAKITPTIVWEGGEKELTPIVIQGEKVKGNGTVIDFKPGGRFSYNDKFDYEPAMRRSSLILKIEGSKGGKTVVFDPETIAQGIVATANLIKLVGETADAKDKFVKDIPDSKEGLINYDKNRAELKNSEKKREEIISLKEYVEAANEDERKEFIGVELTSYASPEGSLEINTKVSHDRSKTIDKFVSTEFKSIDDFQKENFFKTLVTEEDWGGFKDAVAKSNLEDKDMIIRVVNMNSDPVKREEEIRNMKATFVELEKEVLPHLRRSEVKVNIMLIGHTNEEIQALFVSNPSKLTLEEFLYLGALTEDNNKKLAIYTKASELYTNDWRTFNNLSAVQYNLGDYASAKTSIEKAKSLDANATVFNNLGNIQLTNGQITEAETSFKTATGVPQASAGQGAIAIKSGNYKNASDYFGNNCSFNAGLAKLLNGELDAVEKAASCGNDKEQAMNYYIKAIASARQGKSDQLFNNLRTACAKDATLKDFASKDVEFIKFFEDETFKSIVK